MGEKGPHPFFDDRRAVLWYTRLDDALAAARDEGRRVFLCLGGPRCSGTRALVERTIAKEEIGAYLGGHFVPVAIDPDDPIAATSEVRAIRDSLPKRDPTPLCIYLAPDGRLVHSTAGARPAAVLLTDMLEAQSRGPR